MGSKFLDLLPATIQSHAVFSVRRYLPFIIVAAIAVATLVGGAILYRAKRLPALTIPGNFALGKGDADSFHARGASDAPVTLVEFGDFQCPPCADLAEPINQLERDYRSRLRVVFHHFPLANHQHAREAALASEAAGLQGRFWEMHDLLYREQPVWSNAPDVRVAFSAYAGRLGLDIDQFKKDMASDKAKTRVGFDEEQAVTLDVKSTPTIFINNQEVPPAYRNPAGLRVIVDAALRAPAPASSPE
jgi:protein-disulfide isomerase